MNNSLDISRLEKTKWKYIHKRKRTPFYTYLLWDGMTHHYNEKISFSYEMKNWLSLDGDLMVEEQEYNDLQDKAVSELKKNPNFLLDTVEIAYALDQEIVGFLKKLEKQAVKTELLKEEKLENFRKYVELSLKAASFMLFPMFLENYLEATIKSKVIDKYGEEKSKEIMNVFSVPIKFTSTLEEEMAVLQIAQNANYTQEDCQNLAAEFGWLKNSLMDGNYYLAEDYKMRIEEIIKQGNVTGKLASIMESQKKHAEEVESYKKELGQDVGNLIDTLLEAIYFRSWRTERMYRNISLIKNYINSVGKTIGIENSADIFSLTPIEIVGLLQSGSLCDLSIIDQREKGFLIHADGIETKIYSGDIFREAKERVKFLDLRATEEIKGQVAYPGKATGKALIINGKGDFSKVVSDFILIAPSTTPDFVPIMKKSLAIVTDEGGILSHASVISRELKIPCIIGTKIATQVLKDGDMVEVDAEQGIVNIKK